MKRFISALSSAVIAATAMGGALAFTTDAAVNTSVDKTIISMMSGGKRTIDVQAGTTIPVQVYIPQSSGFDGLTMKFAIGKDGNLKDTLGKGTVKDRSDPPKVIENYKDAFGNYGIEMIPKGDKDSGFTRPGCLCSGKLQGKTKQAGNAGTGTTQFTAETWIVIWKAGSLEMAAKTPIDSYGDWVAHGGDVTNKEFDYDNYTRVTSWTKDESWAYEYSLLDFELVLPEDLETGSYTFDIFRDTIVNTHPSSLFDDNNNPVADEKRNTLKSKVAFGETIFDYDTEPLTINVTNGTPVTTTVTTATTPITTEDVTANDSVPTTIDTTTEAIIGTTTTDTTTAIPANYVGKIEYDLVPQGKEYTKAADNNHNNNSVAVAKGEELTVDWMISEDPGTAGMQIALDFSEVTYVKGILGDAYEVIPQFNDNNPQKPGQVVYAWAKNAVQDCDTEEPIYSFKIKAPEKDGVYSITIDDKELNKVVPKDETKQYQIDFHGLDLIVGDPDTTTTPEVVYSDTTTTTTVTTTETTDATTVTTTETTDATTVTTTSVSTTEDVTANDSETTTTVTNTTPVQTPGITSTTSTTTYIGTPAVVTTTTETGDTHETTTTTTADPGKVLFGDVDCDGDVRINDVVLLNKYLAKNAQVSPQGLKNADCEYDNQVNSKDTTKIKQFLAMFIEQTDLGKQA